jgi:hypothetical protein
MFVLYSLKDFQRHFEFYPLRNHSLQASIWSFEIWIFSSKMSNIMRKLLNQELEKELIEGYSQVFLRILNCGILQLETACKMMAGHYFPMQKLLKTL